MRNLAAVAVILAIPMLLVGCSTSGGVSQPGPPDPVNSGSTSSAAPGLCVNGEADFVTSHTDDTLTSDCAKVVISADDVTLTAAGIGNLVVSGNKITVGGEVIGPVTISGQDDALLATGIGPISVKGNGNTVTALGSIGALTVQGNDNTVTTPGEIASVKQSGTGNTIGG